MSTTMKSQGGWSQLEQSDMRLPLNMATMVTGDFSRATIEETKYLTKQPHAEVQETKMQGVLNSEFHQVKDAKEGHAVMLRQNLRDGCLPCDTGTAQNLQSHSRHKETGGPPPDQCRQPPPELMPPVSGMPPAPPGNNAGVKISKLFLCIRIYVFSYLSSLRWMIYPWCICPGESAWYRLGSRYAD